MSGTLDQADDTLQEVLRVAGQGMESARDTMTQVGRKRTHIFFFLLSLPFFLSCGEKKKKHVPFLA